MHAPCPLGCRRDPWWLTGLLVVVAFSLGVCLVVAHDALEREVRERGLYEPLERHDLHDAWRAR